MWMYWWVWMLQQNYIIEQINQRQKWSSGDWCEHYEALVISAENVPLYMMLLFKDWVDKWSQNWEYNDICFCGLGEWDIMLKFIPQWGMHGLDHCCHHTPQCVWTESFGSVFSNFLICSLSWLNGWIVFNLVLFFPETDCTLQSNIFACPLIQTRRTYNWRERSTYTWKLFEC